MKLEISDKYAMDLAYFCKRVALNNAIELAYGETDKEQIDMGYRILQALDEISQSLEKAGYSPR